MYRFVGIWHSAVQFCITLKKVKASHTRYRAMDPELIPVYRQSACRWPLSHPPGGRLPLLSARPAVTSPAAKHHRPLSGTKLYCLVTEAHRCEQLAQGCYAALPRAGFEPATYWSKAQMPYRYTTAVDDRCITLPLVDGDCMLCDRLLWVILMWPSSTPTSSSSSSRTSTYTTSVTNCAAKWRAPRWPCHSSRLSTGSSLLLNVTAVYCSEVVESTGLFVCLFVSRVYWLAVSYKFLWKFVKRQQLDFGGGVPGFLN